MSEYKEVPLKLETGETIGTARCKETPEGLQVEVVGVDDEHAHLVKIPGMSYSVPGEKPKYNNRKPRRNKHG